MRLVYLDVSCLKRPFDDQGQDRIRFETAAVASILERVERGELGLVRSPAHDLENSRNPREDRRLAMAAWLGGASLDLVSDPPTIARGDELRRRGFGPVDALHLAFAEKAGAEAFVTCDDRLLSRARRLRDALSVSVVGPLELPEGRDGP